MSDREAEVEAIKKRVAEIGEKDGDGHWLELTCAKELGITAYERVWIHTTRRAKFVRFEKKSGKIGYNRRGALLGDEGQPRMVHVTIGGVKIYRHRATALAAGIMTPEQYRDTKNFVIDHVEPRRMNEVPDDQPENLRVVPPGANNTNPKNKKPRPRADSKPVTLKRKSQAGAEGGPRFCEHLTFPSAFSAATFLGVYHGNLIKYLSRKEGSRRVMPKGKGAEWDAAWTKIEGFECADAVPIPGVPEDDNRRLSPTRGLLRALGNGKYALAANVPNMHGYLTTWVGGKDVLLHRLVFKTFKRPEFDAELAKLPPGANESRLQIDHIDGDKLNNALSNLRPMDSRAHNSKHSAAIRWIDGDGVPMTYATLAEAARSVRGTDGQPLNAGGILMVCRGDCTHAGGRRFEYVDADHAKELAATSAEKKRKIDAVYGAERTNKNISCEYNYLDRCPP